MRTDHIEKLLAACNALSHCAGEALAEHKRQMEAIEGILASAQRVTAGSGPSDDRGSPNSAQKA